MPKHLQREIENLKKKLLALGAKVEAVVRDAAISIEKRDGQLAQKVVDNDVNIDYAEVEIEEDCLKILALHQPVAIDLRFIVAILKINNDLERIGDLAVNMAERGVYLAEHPKVNISLDLVEMARNAQLMLKMSLDALVELDTNLAEKVCASDDAIDEMNRQIYEKVQEAMLKNPEQIPSLVHFLSASRQLERIADHATNIAEDVIYMIEGQIIRHKKEKHQ